MSQDGPQVDPHALDDAAYVLGALPPQQRAAYEAHLTGCPACARSLAELSGMPGLLDRVPSGVAEALDDAAAETVPLPETLLPGVLRRAEREQAGRRRRRRLLLAVPAAVAAVAVVLALAVTGALRPAPERQATGQVGATTRIVALHRVADVPLAVQARLTPVAWGTRIELHCSYDRADGPSAYRVPPAYSVVLRGTDGRVEQVAGWRAVPGREVVVPAATELRPGQITELEVRTAAGEAVLRSRP